MTVVSQSGGNCGNIRKSNPVPGVHRLIRDCSGASAVEFAMIAPLFLALFIATAQYGVIIFKMVDMRFQANQYARALAAQAVQSADAKVLCNQKLGPNGYSCDVTEDNTSFTVSINYDTSTSKLLLFPQPPVVSYSAYQLKYAVQ